jgi:hypothetical protein
VRAACAPRALWLMWDRRCSEQTKLRVLELQEERSRLMRELVRRGCDGCGDGLTRPGRTGDDAGPSKRGGTRCGRRAAAPDADDAGHVGAGAAACGRPGERRGSQGRWWRC